MRRYNVSCLCDIVTEADDDGQRGAEGSAPSPRARPQSQAPQSAPGDAKATALKALWATCRAAGVALGLDNDGTEALLREKLQDYNAVSTKELSLEQLKQLRLTLKAIEKENTP